MTHSGTYARRMRNAMRNAMHIQDIHTHSHTPPRPTRHLTSGDARRAHTPKLRFQEVSMGRRADDVPTDGRESPRKGPRTAEEWEAYVMAARDRVRAAQGDTADRPSAPSEHDDDPWGWLNK